MKEYNVLVVGVGGMGVLTTAQLLARTALKQGFSKALIGEIHGMAQRGGSVIAEVRFGEEILSPIIPFHRNSLYLALELFEALRYSYRVLNNDCYAVLNNFFLKPPLSKIEMSSETVLKYLRNKFERMEVIDATKMAKEAGSSVSANVALVAAATAFKFLPLGEDSLKETMKEMFKGENLELNIKTFDYTISRLGKR